MTVIKSLKNNNIEHDGSIIIKFRRERDLAFITITDHATGMSAEKMDKAVGIYGEETHEFEGGQGGRRFFGRGLKEAILSMGDGNVKSIENNYFDECVLNIDNYVRAVPKEATDDIKNAIEIPSRGTRVILTINRPGMKIRIPQFESLKRRLKLHYALRDILSSPRRNVVLIELGPKGERKRES